MFAKLFLRKSAGKSPIIVAHIAARLQPLQRGDFFEDPLNEGISALGIGALSVGEPSLQMIR